jgi:hypothetical protein
VLDPRQPAVGGRRPEGRPEGLSFSSDGRRRRRRFRSGSAQMRRLCRLIGV